MVSPATPRARSAARQVKSVARLRDARRAVEGGSRASPPPAVAAAGQLAPVLGLCQALCSAASAPDVLAALERTAALVLGGERSRVQRWPPGPAAPPGDGAELSLCARAVGRAQPQTGPSAALAAPVLVPGGAAACLLVDAPSPAEATLAASLAALAGSALERLRLQERTGELTAQRERALQQAHDAAHTRDAFLAVASHELRTPITALLLQVQGMRRLARSGDGAALTPERTLARLEVLERQGIRLSRLVANLLDISRITAGRLELVREAVDLGAVARDALRRTRTELEAAGCPVVLDAPAPVPGVGDRARLEQVVEHLLTNAAKYGPGRPVRLTVDQAGGMARLVVEDQGIGISPADQERIFGRFERGVSERHYGGLGLGLWISRQVLRGLGGEVSVRSRPGKGSAFTVTLPQHRGAG